MSCTTNKHCVSKRGCPDGRCPDFRIKQHDTQPPFEIFVKDDHLPIDLSNTVLEVSMWADAKFKGAVDVGDTYFQFADNIGFEQVMVGDILVVSGNPRTPEQMLITGFDEENYLVQVNRGYNGTQPYAYKRGTSVKIFRVLNSTGTTEMTYIDVERVEGGFDKDVLSQSKLIYNWQSQDTCLPGCYHFEFKLLTMQTVTPDTSDDDDDSISRSHSWNRSYPGWSEPGWREGTYPFAYAPELSGITPSFLTPSQSELACGAITGVQGVRRFPCSGTYLIEIVESPTSEAVVT